MRRGRPTPTPACSTTPHSGRPPSACRPTLCSRSTMRFDASDSTRARSRKARCWRCTPTTALPKRLPASASTVPMPGRAKRCATTRPSPAPETRSASPACSAAKPPARRRSSNTRSPSRTAARAASTACMRPSTDGSAAPADHDASHGVALRFANMAWSTDEAMGPPAEPVALLRLQNDFTEQIRTPHRLALCERRAPANGPTRAA